MASSSSLPLLLDSSLLLATSIGWSLSSSEIEKSELNFGLDSGLG